MVLDWLVLRAGPSFFISLSCLFPFRLQLIPFLYFLSKGWHSGAVVFELTGCQAHLSGYALPPVFGDNVDDNDNNIYISMVL